MKTETNRDASSVETSTYGQTLITVDRIVSECMYEGIPVDRPSALAAAYSVPDGAPIWMAADNVVKGTLPSIKACERHEKLRLESNKRMSAIPFGAMR